MSKLTTATVLAFERNLDISDGFMAQKNSQNENSGIVPVRIQEKSIRGTISNRLKNTITNDPAKLDAEIEKANLQKGLVLGIGCCHHRRNWRWHERHKESSQ